MNPAHQRAVQQHQQMVQQQLRAQQQRQLQHHQQVHQQFVRQQQEVMARQREMAARAWYARQQQRPPVGRAAQPLMQGPTVDRVSPLTPTTGPQRRPLSLPAVDTASSNGIGDAVAVVLAVVAVAVVIAAIVGG